MTDGRTADSSELPRKARKPNPEQTEQIIFFDNAPQAEKDERERLRALEKHSYSHEVTP